MPKLNREGGISDSFSAIGEAGEGLKSESVRAYCSNCACNDLFGAASTNASGVGEVGVGSGVPILNASAILPNADPKLNRLT